ncbi:MULTISPECIES: tRNA (guanosine(37)-N1)-methyltransferase TrmD [Terrabacteria group]|uniref:tRNA (guanosine(37)-N1)-methyltransferase TrmD n=1 Tax=Bacillati TaxID=1783272 RepID=UPI0019392FA9|nr:MULTISPECIES: tRNA (guanosine(37)-N1)-methyltransferase TrmD [Terrabacteria group]MBW9212066.1 tRNA (guanosine(37)-N1)-methyltransferase TrmD [Trueperella sp. zg.1013]QRG87128.1 tRNA (guanosine(37)-N1)-methyltransferase TrmD [Bulleidia sp. zg-1006]
MKISIISLFPEVFSTYFDCSILGRAQEKGFVEIEYIQLRDFGKGVHRSVDDRPFGGGKGQLIQCEPVLKAIRCVQKEDSKIYLLAPSGCLFNQKKAHEMASCSHIILVCGHYEGFDYRLEEYCDGVFSIGDYVLSGGELAAMVITDAIVRLLPGVISEGSTKEESFENGLLEYPQYTQPAIFEEKEVPEVLRSGNHAKIDIYRKEQALLRTKKMRPDLYEAYQKKEN